MTDTTKTNFPLFCKGRECPEIQRLEGRIDKIYTRLDLIMGGIITVLVTIIGGLLA
jgi:hypothetical protein